MVSSWTCKVSYVIHINGRRVIEPVLQGKGKMRDPEPEDRKDPKRACVVPSKGCEVVGLGYSRVTGVVAMVMGKRENSGNHGWVNRVSQNRNMDKQANRVGRASWVGQVT
jgi:hypothetical protein